MNSFCFFFLIICSLGWAQDYCSLCDDHTMCLYTEIDSLDECGDIIERGVSDNDKNIILNRHNELRSNLAQGNEHRGLNSQSQPGAKNMHKLYWNDELAAIAQRWADQCHWGHDKCRKTGTYGWVGENIFIVFSGGELGKGADFSAAIDSFWVEVNKFDPNNISPFKFTEDTGHYTQMAWAETVNIGCGYTHFHVNGEYKKYYVCNYGPGGNLIGAKVYNVGNACDDCRGNCENGLCT